MLKLNLGSGPKELHLKGYENLDLIDGKKAYPLEYDSGEVDEIRASHVLEHFGKNEVQSVLRDWVDKLRPGGILQIAVPDFDKIASAYVNQVKQEHSPDKYIMGGQDDANDFHKSIFNKEVLTKLMEAAGLQNIQVWESEVTDYASYAISLNLEGTKPGGMPTNIKAVMTLPRLGFTANMFAATKVFPKLGITLDIAHGVFWGQKLSRLIDRHLNDGTEYIITLDYDTAFREEHVIRLLQLMAENPDVDAIVPVQIKRENETPMFSIVDENGEGRRVPLTEFETELVQITDGHFGLTIFRASAFEGLKKPWFLPHPNKDGDWGEGRIDEDIHFWRNFCEDGRNVCLATTVMIGHLQMMATFPGPARKSFKPVHHYMNQLDSGQWPEHCFPKVELLK
jgi:predicted SAM-dependent methyltransferase